MKLFAVVSSITVGIAIVMSSETVSAGSIATKKEESTPHLIKGLDLYLGYWMAPGIVFEPNDGQEGPTMTIENMAYSKNYIPNFGARYQLVQKQGLGFNVGARYEFPREIKKISMKEGSTSVTLRTDNPSQLSLFVLEANATYAMDRGYLFGGVNFPHLIIENSEQVKGVSENLGYQIGLGWDWGHSFSNITTQGHMAFETYYQVLYMNPKESPIDYNGKWEGLGFRLAFNY